MQDAGWPKTVRLTADAFTYPISVITLTSDAAEHASVVLTSEHRFISARCVESEMPILNGQCFILMEAAKQA